MPAKAGNQASSRRRDCVAIGRIVIPSESEESEVFNIFEYLDFSPAECGIEMTKKGIATQSGKPGTRIYRCHL
jgi:hypothetical protein